MWLRIKDEENLKSAIGEANRTSQLGISVQELAVLTLAVLVLRLLMTVILKISSDKIKRIFFYLNHYFRGKVLISK